MSHAITVNGKKHSVDVDDDIPMPRALCDWTAIFRGWRTKRTA